jgi:polar amino acid transport system permease protein
MSYTLQFGQVFPYIPYLIGGAWISFQIAFIAFWGGMIIGLMGAMCLTFGGRVLRGITHVYVAFFTNTPGLVQIFFLYYALPEAKILLSSYEAVLLGITLNAGGYLTLILRGGFLSVRQSEIEAGETLGMNRFQLLRYVILPHIAHVLFPPISNKFILMVLGTAVAGVFGVEDLMGRTINANAETFRAIELFMIAAVIYVIMTVVATLVLGGIGQLFFRRRSRA